MASLVTPGRVRAVYRLLREFPPFNRWDMPAPEAVRCYTHGDLQSLGMYDVEDERHTISINPHSVLTLEMLVSTVAHEMAHMRQEMIGKRPETKDDQHNRDFYKIARLICRDLGFDPARF